MISPQIFSILPYSYSSVFRWVIQKLGPISVTTNNQEPSRLRTTQCNSSSPSYHNTEGVLQSVHQHSAKGWQLFPELTAHRGQPHKAFLQFRTRGRQANASTQTLVGKYTWDQFSSAQHARNQGQRRSLMFPGCTLATAP